MSKTNATTPSPAMSHLDWLAVVKKKVEGLSYGVVQIVVHNRRVTQIECTEKTRMDSPAAEAALRSDEA